MGVLGSRAIGARGGSKCWRGAERSVWRAMEGTGVVKALGKPANGLGWSGGRISGEIRSEKPIAKGVPASANCAQRSTVGLSNQG